MEGVVRAPGLQFATVCPLYGECLAGHAGRNGKGQKRFDADGECHMQPILRKGDHQ